MFWDQDISGSSGCFGGIGMLWGIKAVPVLRRVCHQRGAGGLGGLYPFYRLVFFHFQSSPELQAGFLVWFWGVAERFDGCALPRAVTLFGPIFLLWSLFWWL